MIKELISINDTTYEIEMLSGDKVEIGDREAVGFKPHLKLNRWGGECFVKVGLPTAEKIAPVVEADKVKWIGSKLDSQFYPLEPTAINELGGFEFEITLKDKPATNEIVLDFEAQGLRFAYQPPLTQQEIDEGCTRPDNVIGSYAVYHATKKNNQYMTGKAFHIYRPEAENAEGKKTWCSIHIENGKLTVTIPQQFLDEAIYPVTIDPDFGYQVIGASNRVIANEGISDRVGSAWTMPAGGGTANYIRAYIFGSNACDCKIFINQKDSGGANIHGQIATKENLACAVAAHWEEFTLGSEALTATIDYILNIIGDGTDQPGEFDFYYVKYDVDGATAVARYLESPHNYGAPENPWLVGPTAPVWDCSIYCNYTEAAAGLENKSASMGAKMIAGKLI